MDELHVGSIVHYLHILPADDEHPEDDPICEAAIVTKIHNKEKGLVSLLIFPALSEMEEEEAAHGVSLTTGDTWHFLSECPIGS